MTLPIALYKDDAKAIRPGQLFMAQHAEFSTAKVDIIPVEIPGVKTILTCKEHKRQFCTNYWCQYPYSVIASVENESDVQIHELQAQIALLKGTIEEQKKIIDDARHYVRDLQYKSGNSAIFWSLCEILKIPEETS
jgi:hypothetical protein